MPGGLSYLVLTDGLVICQYPVTALGPWRYNKSLNKPIGDAISQLVMRGGNDEKGVGPFRSRTSELTGLQLGVGGVVTRSFGTDIASRPCNAVNILAHVSATQTPHE